MKTREQKNSSNEDLLDQLEQLVGRRNASRTGKADSNRTGDALRIQDQVDTLRQELLRRMTRSRLPDNTLALAGDLLDQIGNVRTLGEHLEEPTKELFRLLQQHSKGDPK